LKPHRENLALSRWSKLRAFRRISPAGFEYDPHFHPEHELVLIEHGRGDAYIGAEVVPFQEGDVVALDQGVTHAFTCKSAARALVLQYDVESLAGFDPQLVTPARVRNVEGVVFERGVGAQIHRALDLAATRWQETESPRDGLVLRSILLDVLAALSQADVRAVARVPGTLRGGGERGQQLERVLGFIESQHKGGLSLSEAARFAGMRPESLCRFLKRHLGMTFTQYVNEVRLGEAARALADTDRLVLDIALEAGYQNLSYFNRRFKRRFHLTPVSYREKHRGQLPA
jgi:AraC-like DNA-binding protein